MTRALLSLLLIFLIFSCKSYEVMQYDVLRPAVFSVPPTIKSIVIVDNAYPFNPDDAHIAHVVGDEVRLDTVRVDTFSTVIISELKAELNWRQFFDTVYVDTTRYNPKTFGKPLRQLTPSQINTICDAYNADAVLSLAGVNYGTTITVEDMGVEYYSTMDVRGLLFWRMFDKYNHETMYANVQRDTLYWDSVAEDINVSVGVFPSIEQATIELGAYLGARFADQLSPHWETVERKFYIAGNAHFVNAAEWYGKGNRFEAEKLWGFVYEHGNSREKGRAANNIAISMEARGEMQLAMEWAYKSFESFETKGVVGSSIERATAKELYVDMVQRYRDMKKLNEQVGSEL